MIRKIFVVIISFSIIFSLKSQNLVPNPSFEELRNLPIKRLEVYNYEFESISGNKAFKENLNYWFSGNNNSPDLRILNIEYNGRSKSKYDKYYKARTGENVLGIVTYIENKKGSDFREYIEVRLKTSLRPNIKTYVEFWVLLDRQSKLSSNNIGCYFSIKKIYSKGNVPIIIKPQINEDSIVRGDRYKWKKISGSFNPKDAFNFMTIGNFYERSETKLEEIENFRGKPFIDPTSYYLIDDVSVWQEGDKEEKVFKEKEIKEGTIIELDNVEFDSNSSKLKEKSYSELNELVNLLKNSKELKIGIYGHTDNVGKEERNLKLSKSRALSIYNYLIGKGIEKERMLYEGFGESNPISDNRTEEGRKKNRRVEFIILSKK